MAESDSTVVRDHSFQDLNPLLNFNTDGSIDAEESLARIEGLSAFLTHYLEHHSGGGDIDYGLYLISATLQAAVSRVREQSERASIKAQAATILAERERGGAS